MEYEDKKIYLEEDAVACSVFILATPLLCVKKLARQMWTFKGTPQSSGSAADPAAGFSFIQLLLEITEERTTEQKTTIKKFAVITAAPTN